MKRIRNSLLAVLILLAAVANAQPGREQLDQALAAYAQSEQAEAFILVRNALQANPNLIEARILLARIYFERGEIRSAEKECAEALLLGADINAVLPIYGPALVLLKNTDELFRLEESAEDFTPESQLEWALLKAQGHLIRGEDALARAALEGAVEAFPASERAVNTLAAYYLEAGMVDEAAPLVAASRRLAPGSAKTLQLSGEYALALGRDAEALAFFRQALEADPEDLRALRALARVYSRQGDVRQVQHYLDLILEASPRDPTATLVSAILKIRQGQAQEADAMLADLTDMLSGYQPMDGRRDPGMVFIRAASEYVRGNDVNAINLFNGYLAGNPGDLMAIRILTDLYVRTGRIGEAADLLADNREFIAASAAPRDGAGDLAVIRLLSELYRRAGQTDRVIALLSDNRQLIATDVALSVQLATLYLRKGNIYGARDVLNALETWAPEDSAVVLLRAEFLKATGQLREALALLSGSSVDAAQHLPSQLLLGRVQLDLAMFPEAQQTAQALAARYPGVPEALNFSTEAFLRSGNVEAAERANQDALAAAPKDPSARFHRALILKQQGEFKAAGDVIEALLADQPGHVPSLLLLSRMRFLEADYAAALRWCEAALELDRESLPAQELLLDIYVASGDYDNARSIAQALSDQKPLNDRYLVRLAELYLQSGDFELLQRPLRRLLTLWQDDPEKLRQLAAMQLYSQNPEEARLSLKRALNLAPDSYSVRFDLARLDLQAANYDAVREQLAALQEDFSGRAGLFYLEGELALAQGQSEAAQTLFMRAFTTENDNLLALNRLFELSSAGVGRQEFIAALEAALREASLPVAAVRMLADTYLLDEQAAKARGLYERLLTVPGMQANPEVLNNLAMLYAETDLDRALATARQALDASPAPNPAVLDTLGWLLVRKGEHQLALTYLREAQALNPANPEIGYHLALALSALGRQGEARSELRKALADDRAFAGREAAMRLLRSLEV